MVGWGTPRLPGAAVPELKEVDRKAWCLGRAVAWGYVRWNLPMTG